MICPRCGRPTVQGASYCGECGVKLPIDITDVNTLIKRGERELDVAAKTAGDGLQSVIDDIKRALK